MNTTHRFSPQRPASRSSRRAGFTLIEIMVVLSIMALITAITAGTFKSLGDSNQRTGCQTNLTQIYQGLRLYMADYDNHAPLYNPSAAAGSRNIGLWSLWTFPDPANLDRIATVGQAPNSLYLRSTNVLHCPSDSEPRLSPPQSPATQVNPADLYTTAAKDNYNPSFLSYQTYAVDNRGGQPVIYAADDVAADYASPSDNFWTYLPTRLPATTANISTPAFKRQLRQNDPNALNPTVEPPLRRTGADSTVVTWCRHHRYVRDYDNVLFFDGSVQLLRKEQDQFSTDGQCTVTGVLKGAERVHRRIDCDE